MRDHEGAIVVDGASAPKPEPFSLRLRDLNPLPVPTTIELPIEAFIEHGGWVNTQPAEID